MRHASGCLLLCKLPQMKNACGSPFIYLRLWQFHNFSSYFWGVHLENHIINIWSILRNERRGLWWQNRLVRRAVKLGFWTDTMAGSPVAVLWWNWFLAIHAVLWQQQNFLILETVSLGCCRKTSRSFHIFIFYELFSWQLKMWEILVFRVGNVWITYIFRLHSPLDNTWPGHRQMARCTRHQPSRWSYISKVPHAHTQ